MVKILAKLPNKKKVFHGELQYGVFQRRISSDYIRFSDRSFCLNTSVIEELVKRHCHTLEFIWIKAEEKVTYRIDFQKALETCETKINEYGESNLRIPIIDCNIFNRVQRKIISENIENQEDKIIQNSLF